MKSIWTIALNILLLFFFTQQSLADTCPTPSEIAQNQFNGWTAYIMSPDPQLATPAQIQVFQTYPNLAYTYAIWHATLPPLPGVCIYTDPGVILAKDVPQPITMKGNWVEENRLGQIIYVCMKSNPQDCIFGAVPHTKNS